MLSHFKETVSGKAGRSGSLVAGRTRVAAYVFPGVLAVLLTTSAFLMFRSLTPVHDWGDDFADYIMQARSLCDGAPRAFVDANHFTISHSSCVLGPDAYPWGYPLLITPIYAIFGLNLLALKTVGVIFYLLFLLVMCLGFRGTHRGPWLVCLVSILALNPTMLGFSNQILSDVPFLMASTLCIVLITRASVQERAILSPFPDRILIGAAIAFACSIRGNGVLLLPTLGLSELIAHLQDWLHSRRSEPTNWRWSRTWRPTVIALLPYTAFLSTTLMSHYLLPDGTTSYLTVLKGASLAALKGRASYYLELPSEFFSGLSHAHLIYGATIPLALAGAIRRSRSDYPAIIYVIVTVLLYIVYPYRQGIRYLLPVLPFYLSFALSGLEEVCKCDAPLERRIRTALCYASVVLVAISFGLTTVRQGIRHSQQGSNSGPFATNSEEMFSFIREHTDCNSIIVFFKPRAMRLMTSRSSIALDRPERLSGCDYVCIYRSTAPITQLPDSEIERLTERGLARIVYANDDFIIYQMAKAPVEVPSKGAEMGRRRCNLSLISLTGASLTKGRHRHEEAEHSDLRAVKSYLVFSGRAHSPRSAEMGATTPGGRSHRAVGTVEIPAPRRSSNSRSNESRPLRYG